MSYRVGIDTGSTFTDALSIDEKGDVVTVKARTTPKDLKLGVINVLDGLAKRNSMDRKQFLGQVTAIVHGTTQGTATVLTRSGARVGIIATEGQTDVIQLRKVRRENMWNWRVSVPQPLVPRYLRVGVKERVTSTGDVLRPLDEEGVRKAVAYLKKMRVENIVVALIFSFLNPGHERRIREIIKEDYPEAHVTLSHEILPAAGEYERTNTAVIDAYIRPAIADYIQSLRKYLEEEGFKGQLFLMQNNGGIETAETAIVKPSTLAISGPAAGPIAALEMGKLHGNKNLLSIDMGETSFDVAIIDNGRIAFKTENIIAQQRFSLPIASVDTLGAGGGSTAWFDLGGTFHVGPKSAGAEPGPACYGTGGEEATVTDAYVILGYISPDYLLAGEIKLRRDLAEKAIKEKVADRLGFSISEAAAAMYKLSNVLMADGLSHNLLKGGYNPRDFILCAGGSVAPLCAIKIAEEIGVARVLITKYAPVYRTFGMLAADLRHDFTRYYQTAGHELDLNKLKGLYEEMEAEGISILEKEGVPKNQRSLLRTMRLKYYLQLRDVGVSWPGNPEPITKDTIAEGIANFHRRHRQLYGSSDENYPLEFISFGLTAVGKMPGVTLKEIKSGSKDPSSALNGERDVYFEESNGFVKTKIYDGNKLLAGNVLEGPCIVEESLTNVVIPPTFKMRVDEYGNYVTA